MTTNQTGEYKALLKLAWLALKTLFVMGWKGELK